MGEKAESPIDTTEYKNSDNCINNGVDICPRESKLFNLYWRMYDSMYTMRYRFWAHFWAQASWYRRAAVVSAAVVAYAITATWLQMTYVDLRPAGSTVIELRTPFVRFGHAAISYGAGRLAELADDEAVEDDQRSPVVVYENAVPLGPGHSNFADISELGAGRFVHWRRDGLVFSASDNSDPNTNGRHYWAVLP